MSTDVGTYDKNSAKFAFHFFSELHRRRLLTTGGTKIGRIDDLVFAQKEPYPEALGILVEHGVGQPSRRLLRSDLATDTWDLLAIRPQVSGSIGEN